MSSNTLGSVSKTHYDFVVCGSGSSGSVIARRLAENPAVKVLLLEAGGDDNAHSVTEAARWTTNIAGKRDWGFTSQPASNLNALSVLLSMGKALGGGSTINIMIWARGHRTDWDFFASKAGDPAWNYQSILNISRRIEDWHGEPGPKHRGVDEILFVEPAPNLAESMVFWKSDPNLEATDMQIILGEFFKSTPDNIARFQAPTNGWILFGGLERPKSRGRIRLTGPNPSDPLQIDANFLSDPDDLKAAIACITLSGEIGTSAALKPFVKREVIPGNLKGADLGEYARNGASTYWHQTCTAKMGRDAMSVVDGNLKVCGVENLRIVDGSIMPRITTGNTMAPCIIMGERAAEILRTQHQL
jgi:choline dehydrogenase-like flavoprotein